MPAVKTASKNKSSFDSVILSPPRRTQDERKKDLGESRSVTTGVSERPPLPSVDFKPYSYRNATIGSTRLARRAGT